MANIDITYKGLTGEESPLTVSDSITINTLITTIATDEGLSSSYYKLSLEGYPDVNDLDGASTLVSLGIITGSKILCSPSQSGTKEDRMIQKLEIAQEKRQADGDTTKRYYRTLNTYDINLLPNPYNGNDVTPDDGASDPLTQGRPWT